MFSKTFNFLISQRNTVKSSLTLTRNYALKSDLKIKWVRPEKISCIDSRKSGDLDKIEYPEPTNFMAGYEKSDELKKADEMIKEMFTLEMSKRSEKVELYKMGLVDEVKRHQLDWGSHEVKIAKMTAQIRAMQEYMEQFPRNKHEKVKLKELIEKRKRFLRLLRKWDYKRFEWLIERLNIIFRPNPELFHMVTRKESMRKLTQIHCENLRQEKLDSYRKELEAKQIDFLAEKIKNLEFIRNEQLECRVPVTVTKEEIQSVKKQYEELKKIREEQEEASKKLKKIEDYELSL